MQKVVPHQQVTNPMQLHSLLLSAAAPPALHAVRSVASLASQVGQGFAHALSDIGSSEKQGQGAAVDGEAKPTITEQLGEIASRLRTWLGKQGVPGPFELNLAVDAIGNEQLDFASAGVADGPALLEQNPKLLQELRRLAASLQAATSGLASARVQLRITDSDSQASVL